MLKVSNNGFTDVMIWTQMRSGSVQAYEQLYDKFFPLLFRYGLQFCNERALVKDCLQDFFVDLYIKRSTLSEVQQVKNYLYTSFRHRIIRNVSAKQLMVEPISNGYHFEVNFSHEQALIQEQLDDSRRKKLLNAFNKLSGRQKEAIFLRYYENMGYEEIAEIMKMSKVKSARTLVYRSLGVLKDCIKNLDGSLTLYSAIPFISLLLHKGKK